MDFQMTLVSSLRRPKMAHALSGAFDAVSERTVDEAQE
jgi:hypothetical protein